MYTVINQIQAGILAIPLDIHNVCKTTYKMSICIYTLTHLIKYILSQEKKQ